MNGFKVMFWNAQGLQQKYCEFKQFIRDEDIDIACINETHLTNKITIDPIPDYICIRQDRESHLGGLLTLIKRNIKFEELTMVKTDLMEYTTFFINAERPFIITNAYLPGGAKTKDIKSYLATDLNKLLDHLNYPIFLVGDLNAKHKQWNCKRNNAAGKILLDKTRNEALNISFPLEHTYAPASDKKSPSTIDLIITNSKLEWTRPYVKDLFTSDHLPVFFQISGGDNYKRLPCDNNNSKPNFSKANWREFRLHLDKYLDTTIQKVIKSKVSDMTPRTIDDSVEELTEAIQ